jgi:tetratricopeptide (TPR) repeat protein
MQEQAGWGARFGDKGQLYYYLALVAVVLLAVGLLVFVMLALLPAWRLTTALHADLKLAQENLELRERIQADAPRQAQQQVSAAEAQQTAAAGRFLHEETAGLALDRLYAYGAAAGVEVVDLQSQPVAGGEVFTQRSYALRAVGEWDQLLDFLARLEEAALPGFVVGNLKIAPEAAAPETAATEGAPPHALSTSIVFYVSPYAPAAITAAGEAVTTTAISTTDDLWLQLQTAWQSNDWANAVTLAEQLLALAPDNPGAREALYRVYVNQGYHLLARHHVDEARIQFESALQVKPGGQEAQLELQQIDANALAIFAAEDRLARALQAASAAGEWQEVIRLLRLIQTINPEYPDLETQLRQAYINYGDQLAAQGQAEAAEEQYKQAELLPAP